MLTSIKMNRGSVRRGKQMLHNQHTSLLVEKKIKRTEGWRRLSQPILEHALICGKITCERIFSSLIERRWRVRIRNGYWSMDTLSASTLKTRQCNLTWSRKVQRCWWGFQSALFSYTPFISSRFRAFSPRAFSRSLVWQAQKQPALPEKRECFFWFSVWMPIENSPSQLKFRPCRTLEQWVKCTSTQVSPPPGAIPVLLHWSNLNHSRYIAWLHVAY